MKRYLLIVFLFFTSGCTKESPVSNTPIYNDVEKIAINLESPWSIANDNGTFYISERGGTIVNVSPEGTLTREEVRLSEPLSTVAEAGLTGLVLAENFSESQEAYAYYTYDNDGIPINRIVLLQVEGDLWIEKELLLDGIESGAVHHGGRLALSPDGRLFATIGDGANPDAAQDLNLLNGKIIEFKEGNTFQIFSSGHRNPQGLAWDENGDMYASEHGQSANDEVNLIEEGKNYGWPIIQGLDTKEHMETPLVTSGSKDTWAPSGMAFHKGLLYVGALRGEAILVIDPVAGKLVYKIEGYGRIRDVFSDGDSLYFISNNTDGRGSPSKDDDVLYRLKF
ncbi:PQQ-dependent sugar dehydrogenase [Sporosarcina sp. CAU 1771]